MRGSKKDLPKLINTEGVVTQEVELEDMPVEYDVLHKLSMLLPRSGAYLINWIHP